MKIIDYVKSLLPSFDKKRILENITFLIRDIGEATAKPLEQAAQLFRTKQLLAKSNKEFNEAFQQSYRAGGTQNYIVTLAGIFESVVAKLTFLETIVHHNYTHDITRDGMTYQKATVLKYLEIVEFAGEYARKLLLSTLASETYQLNGRADLVGSESAPAVREWLRRNRGNFFDAIKVLAIPLATMKEKVLSIPDMTVVPETAEHVNQTVGTEKIDPLKLGFVVTTWMNPIYHSRMVLAEWQVERYKKLQEEKRAIEFRLLALNDAYHDKSDPKLQQTIEYTEGRLQKLNYELAQREAEYTSAD